MLRHVTRQIVAGQHNKAPMLALRATSSTLTSTGNKSNHYRQSSSSSSPSPINANKNKHNAHEQPSMRERRRHLATSAAVVDATVVAPPGSGPNHRSVMSLDGNSIRPHVQPNAFVAPSASVIGSVVINDKAMVGYGAVVRGDLALIHIGFASTIGDNGVLTAGEVVVSSSSSASSGDGSNTTRRSRYNVTPTDAVATGLSLEPELVIGDFCMIGANSTLESCFLDGDNEVGHNCRIERGARMARYSVLLPGSTLEQGAQVGKAEIWGGSPAVKVDTVDPDSLIPRRKKVLADNGETVPAHSYEFLPVGSTFWEKEQMAKTK